MRFNLAAEKMPTSWFNVPPRLPEPLQPPLHPVTRSRSARTISRRCSPCPSSSRRCRQRRIDIPGEVLDVLRLWRPTPLVRARRLERALGTPARIYYKDESGSPAGSHKPNTAVPQAFYNQQAGMSRLTTETGAGQWGTALACLRPVRPRLQGLHGPHELRDQALPTGHHGDGRRVRAVAGRRSDIARPRSASPSPTPCETPPAVTTRTTRWARC